MIPFFERSYDWSVETSAKMQGIEPPPVSSFQYLKANVQVQNGKYYIGGYVTGQVGTYAAASEVVKGIPFVGKAIGNAAERLSHLPILNHIGAGHLQNILGGLAVDVVVDTAPETVDDFLEGESAKDIAANTSLNVLENLGWNIAGEGVITGLGKAAEYVGGKWALKGVEEGRKSHYSVEAFSKEMGELPHAKISKTTKEQIIAIPKGGKPNPCLYMSNSEIAEHLSLFDDGVVRIQSKESFDKAIQLYGNNIGDPMTGTFVLPKKFVNKAIQASNGNPRVLEELLGLDTGYLGNNPVLLDINKASNIRIPSGNEAGAWPEYWIPGGYTSGGVPEAVVNQIKAGDYVISDVYPK